LGEQFAGFLAGRTEWQGRVRADVVPEGTGFKLRIQHELGEQLIVTQAAGNNNDAIQALGMDLSEAGLATKLRVNDSLVATPSTVSRGRVQFDEITGRYLLSTGDNEVAIEMASMLSGQVSSKQARSAPAT
jgi:flagellar hook-associated protein 1 FlgK